MRELYDNGNGLSVRDISAQLGVPRATVGDDLKAPIPEPAPPPPPYEGPLPPPAPEGNSRALTHGARSEKFTAPLREEFEAELVSRYPCLPEGMIQNQALRLAQVRLAARWMDERGIVANRKGDVFGVARSAAEWSRAIDNWFVKAREMQAEADAEAAKAREHDVVGELAEEGRQRLEAGPADAEVVAGTLGGESDGE